MAADLFLQIEGRQSPNHGPIATLAEIIRLSTPTMSLGTFQWSASIRSNTGPAQGFRATNMERT
jgi:hypothetical protein